MNAPRACAILDALAAHARARGDDTAIARVGADGEPAGVVTFSQALHDARGSAGALVGVAGAGEVVALVAADGAGAVRWYLGALLAGVRLLPVHPASADAEVRAILERSGARAVIAPPDVAVGGNVKRLGLDAMGRAGDAPRPGGGIVLLSSGTTGGPKLAFRDSAALDADARNIVYATGLGPRDTLLLAVPACHSYGVDMIVAGVLAGAALHVLEPFDPAAAAASLERHATVFPGVPVMFEALARGRPNDDSRLRLAFSAGSPLPDRVADAFERSWGRGVGQLYGATELGSVTLCDPGSTDYVSGSVGSAMPGVSIRVLKPDAPEQPLPSGVEGQVAVRAPSMFSGYLDGGAPLADGHFLTGDLGRLDERGRLFITGRLKLLVDVGGLKVNPQEVEAALSTHPGVAECVVTPLPISDTVTRLRAVFVPRDPGRPPEENALREHLRTLLAGHKVPRVFEAVPSLPRSPTGKVLRALIAGGAMTTLKLAVAIALGTLGVGCAAHLPTYQPMDGAAALHVIADRLESVRTVSSAAGITLTGADGRSIRLEGALAAQAPGHFRLRAWKFNTAVFDLTVADEEVWLMESDRAKARGMGDVPATSIADAMSLIGEPFFRSASPVESAGDVLVASGSWPAGRPVQCEIDRPTLTPRRFRVGDGVLELDRYRVIDGTPWATRWRFRGPQGEVVLRLSDLELNQDLPEAAFVPPRRAVRLEP